MPQAIHIETLGRLHGPSLWQRLTLHINNSRYALVKQSEQLLDLAITTMAKRRGNAMPAKFSRVNRHTWRRYSALIVAQDEMAVQQEVVVKAEAAVITQIVDKPINHCISMRVNRFTTQPIWASANHDWQAFEI